MNLYDLVLSVPAIFIAVMVHELTKAVVSTLLGDKKPRENGMLTLNPLRFFEPIGFILMFATGGFGWGKQVETSTLYYKDRKKGALLTAVAPIAANLITAFLFMILHRHLGIRSLPWQLSYFAGRTVAYNIGLAVYNLVPVSPMDGTRILSAVMPANEYFKYIQYEKIIQMIFLFLLFLQWTDIIISPIILIVTKVLSVLASFL